MLPGCEPGGTGLSSPLLAASLCPREGLGERFESSFVADKGS